MRIGIAGLGGAGSKLLPLLNTIDSVTVTAAADSRAQARESFSNIFQLPAYSSVAEMCASPDVDAVYVATPSQFHCQHSLEAFRAGKHVICEKPLATTLADCDRMIAEAKKAGVLLIQGHSKIFDASVQAMRAVIDSGRLGNVYQVDTWNFNDWMRRPRLEMEIDTAAGGGVVMRQTPQLIDMVRYLIGAAPSSVRATVGRHARGLNTEGNFSSFIYFKNDALATLNFNGYGYFDFSRLANTKPPSAPQPKRFSVVDDSEKYSNIKIARSLDNNNISAVSGLTIVSGEEGVMVYSAEGLHLYTDSGCEKINIPEGYGRASVVIEMRDAMLHKRSGFPDGQWARSTLVICLAILDSAREAAEIRVGI